MPRDHPVLPFVATALAVALFSLMDALMKGASIAVGAYSALLIRSMIGTILVIPVWATTRTDRKIVPAAPILRIHLLRGAVNCAMAVLFFYSLVRLPIAEAIALSFIAPLIALFLAAVILGEKVGKQAIVASLLGLAGVGVITFTRWRSGELGLEEWKGGIALFVSACLFAWNLVLQRKIALLADPREVVLAQNGVMAAILLLFAPWFIVWPQSADLALIGVAAVLASGSMMILAWSYARAEAQVLVPIEYTGFLWAALFGWLFYAESVGLATLTGAILIVAGCLITVPRRTEQTAA
ncbi:MAG: DMT family transporter [Novosphingobium sp.]|nr:DMT family transporter [Novosphingobium sp.]